MTEELKTQLKPSDIADINQILNWYKDAKSEKTRIVQNWDKVHSLYLGFEDGKASQRLSPSPKIKQMFIDHYDDWMEELKKRLKKYNVSMD